MLERGFCGFSSIVIHRCGVCHALVSVKLRGIWVFGALQTEDPGGSGLVEGAPSEERMSVVSPHLLFTGPVGQGSHLASYMSMEPREVDAR